MSAEFNIRDPKDTVSSLTVKGIPFPGGNKNKYDDQDPIADDFKDAVVTKENPIADKFEYDQKAAQDKSKFGERYWAQNALGLQVFMPIKLGGYELPNPCISITGRVTIVEEIIVGQEGTVMEEITINNYDINIKLFVFDDSDLYPEDMVRDLSDLWKKRKLLTIECVLTDFFLQAKDNCVITGISLPDQQACENMQIIELSLRSNKSFELILD
ncbi:MAG TPA: DUF6046 domain-containing protein [Chitinophagales bacterium]|nr:DUF6046 domain-containing protein [Chitinophagales bacterium]